MVSAMLKRSFDLALSLFLLLVLLPILILVSLLIWFQDFHNPLYLAPRVGVNGKIFTMVKLRSMIVGADRTGVDSTGASDARITKLGNLVRRYKLDELVQLWNVIRGDMSLVGPRPNVKRDVDLYTIAERELLSVRPGITDLASIVFSDEGEILKDKSDPDIAYHQLIRPGKAELGIFYIHHRSMILDFKCCLLTALAIVSRKNALLGVQKILQQNNAPISLVNLASRMMPLRPRPPLGGTDIVTDRRSI
jgi:lipopolysaccharide/colanic/teichoic acid biosynthesis glycosyltransferase